jgi:hypothetical protein
VRQRFLFALLGLTVALSVWLTLQNRRAAHLPSSYTEHHPPRAAKPPAASGAAGSTTPEVRLRRNPFEYADATVAPARTAVLAARTASAPTAVPTPEADVKLVGIVRGGGGGGPRAALRIEGTVAVLSVGESAEGYAVLDIGEETGVRVRTPDGREISLTPPPH